LPAVPSVQIGEVNVAYDVQGEGDPVVLVHGSTGSRLTWMLQTPVLAERFRVVLPEYAGGGETTDPGGPLEVADLAAQVLAVTDELGLGRYHLAGYSLGAVVAAAVAARRPDEARSLALVCGWARSDARMAWTFDLWQRLLRGDRELFARYALADGATNAFFEQMGAEIEGMIPMVAGGLSSGSERHAELDARVDISGDLPSITAPTLVVGGKEDRWVPIEHSRHLAEAIAGARLVELDCGHLLPTERGQELAELLGSFFGEHAG
jgi:pimeloyl-ACP methyl ester carboxylesterase